MVHMDTDKMRILLKKYDLSVQELPSEEAVKYNIEKNLKYIMTKYRTKEQVNMPQKDLADLLGIGASQLTKILQKSQMPSVFDFLDRIKRIFGYTIDEFLYTDIEEMEKLHNGAEDTASVSAYSKYLGLYQVYYFDTSSFKGRERGTNGDAVKSGIMFVEHDTKTDKYSVYAIFNIKKEDADALYRNELNCGQGTPEDLRSKIISMKDSCHVYYGEMELSDRHVYVNLRFENVRDRIHMIFHRPETNSDRYIGGLGAMVTVSKGRNASPCLGYMAIARNSLNVSEEELAQHLLTHYPNIKTHGDLDELVELVVSLYTPGNTSLSNDHKKELIEKDIDTIINNTIERNLFRTVVVSPVDDDEFYHYLKEIK